MPYRRTVCYRENREPCGVGGDARVVMLGVVRRAVADLAPAYDLAACAQACVRRDVTDESDRGEDLFGATHFPSFRLQRHLHSARNSAVPGSLAMAQYVLQHGYRQSPGAALAPGTHPATDWLTKRRTAQHVAPGGSFQYPSKSANPSCWPLRAGSTPGSCPARPAGAPFR